MKSKIFFLLLLINISCKNDLAIPSPASVISIPKGFQYNLSSPISLSVKVSNSKVADLRTPFKIYTSDNQEIFSGQTSKSGTFDLKKSLALTNNSLVLKATFNGKAQTIESKVVNNAVLFEVQ